MWEKVKLREICEILNGYAFKSSKYVNHNGARIIRITNVQKGIIVDNDPKLYPFDLLGNLSNFKIFDNDILMSLTGNVGRVGLFPKHMTPAYLNQRVCKIKPNSNKVLNKYLFHYLNSNDFENEAVNASGGAAQLNLSSNWINSHEITLPPLPIQEKIAEILDKADELRHKDKDLQAKYNELAQAIFIDMFGHGVKKISWDIVTIEQISLNKKGSMRTGPFGSDLLHSEFTNKGVSVLGIDNAVENKFSWKQRRYISEEKYNTLKRYTVFPNDIIITIMGTIGKVAIIPEDIGIAINSKHLAAISINTEIANPSFVAFSLHSDPNILKQISSKGRGAIMTGLNLGIIKNIKFKLPPISLQNEFAERIQAIEVQKALAQNNAEKSEELFQALLQKAFKGELLEMKKHEIHF